MAVISNASDFNRLRSLMDSFRVEVILTENSINDPNAVESCAIALNLLPRFLRCVRYRGSVSVLQRFPGSHTSKINLGTDDWKASISLVFGSKQKLEVLNPIYIDSSGWSIYISQDGPCNWSSSYPNGLAAIYAGSLAVGEVFKYVMNEVKSEKISHLEYDLITQGNSEQPVLEPVLPEVIHFENLCLVGCGAIGQALIYTLTSTAPLSGRITLIDPDKLDPSNEQRYVWAFEEYRGQPKINILSQLLNLYNPCLSVSSLAMPYEIIPALFGAPLILPEVVTAVDNIRTRLNIQASIPKILWNVWTDASKGTLRYGVGRHTLDGPYECLACSYFPEGGSPSQMQMNSIRTGFPEDEIRERLRKGDACTQQDIERVARATGVGLDYLRPNIGKPIHQLLHGDCGVFRVPFHENHTVTPAPHVPVLAGVILASQLILSRMKLPESAMLLESVADFDALGIPSSNCFIKKARKSACFCGDSAYQSAYNDKWSHKKE